MSSTLVCSATPMASSSNISMQICNARPGPTGNVREGSAVAAPPTARGYLVQGRAYPNMAQALSVVHAAPAGEQYALAEDLRLVAETAWDKLGVEAGLLLDYVDTRRLWQGAVSERAFEESWGDVRRCVTEHRTKAARVAVAEETIRQRWGAAAVREVRAMSASWTYHYVDQVRKAALRVDWDVGRRLVLAACARRVDRRGRGQRAGTLL